MSYFIKIRGVLILFCFCALCSFSQPNPENLNPLFTSVKLKQGEKVYVIDKSIDEVIFKEDNDHGHVDNCDGPHNELGEEDNENGHLDCNCEEGYEGHLETKNGKSYLVCTMITLAPPDGPPGAGDDSRGPIGGAGNGDERPKAPTEKQCKDYRKLCDQTWSEKAADILWNQTKTHFKDLMGLAPCHGKRPTDYLEGATWTEEVPIDPFGGAKLPIEHDCGFLDLNPTGEHPECFSQYFWPAMADCMYGIPGSTVEKSTETGNDFSGGVDIWIFDAEGGGFKKEKETITERRDPGQGVIPYIKELKWGAINACAKAYSTCMNQARGGVGLVVQPVVTAQQLINSIDQNSLGINSKGKIDREKYGLNESLGAGQGGFKSLDKQVYEGDNRYKSRLQFLINLSKYFTTNNLTKIKHQEINNSLSVLQSDLDQIYSDYINQLMILLVKKDDTPDKTTDIDSIEIPEPYFYQKEAILEMEFMDKMKLILENDNLIDKFIKDVWPGVESYHVISPMATQPKMAAWSE